MTRMSKKVISYCTCFVLAWPNLVNAGFDSHTNIELLNEQAIVNQYPNAKILHVSTEQYPQLVEQLRTQGYSQAAIRLASNDGYSTDTDDTQSNTKSSDDCGNNGSSAGEESIQFMLDVSSEALEGASGGNDETAAIVFVVIGTVLVVVWALYVFKYLYDVSTGFNPCGYWSEFTYASSRISGSSNEYADFNGIKYMTGFRDGGTEVGISIELGQAEILLPQLLNQRLEGLYWLLGPVLRWRMSTGKNPHIFSMNFLAGSTEHDEMGVIAQASLGVQFGLGESMHLGFSWGAMNIDVKERQGILNDSDEYYYLYGVNFGFRF